MCFLTQNFKNTVIEMFEQSLTRARTSGNRCKTHSTYLSRGCCHIWLRRWTCFRFCLVGKSRDLNWKIHWLNHWRVNCNETQSEEVLKTRGIVTPGYLDQCPAAWPGMNILLHLLKMVYNWITIKQYRREKFTYDITVYDWFILIILHSNIYKNLSNL